MTAYRRVSAVAVAALLISGIAAPAALAATPDRAPAATAVAPSPNTVLVGAGLTLDLSALIDLEAHGIVAVGVGGAASAEGRVQLKVGKGSVLSHKNKKITGGKVSLVGGIELRKGGKKVVISNVVVDVRTGLITAKVGAKVGVGAAVKLGAVLKSDSVYAELHSGDSSATLSLAKEGIALNAAVLANIGTQIGTCIEVDADAVIDAALDVDLDLAVGAVVDVDLVAALGLDVALGLDLDLGLNVDALLDLDAAVQLDLGLGLGIL